MDRYEFGYQQALEEIKSKMVELSNRDGVKLTPQQLELYSFILNEEEESRVREDSQMSEMEESLDADTKEINNEQ